MGFRISRGVGWGLTPQQFKDYSPLDSEELYQLLSSKKEFIIPRSEHKTDPTGDWSVCENLLTGFGYGRDLLKPCHHLSAMDYLYSHVINYDTECLYLFYPDASWVKEYYRRDNGLDYIMANLDDSPGVGYVKELKSNPYPYNASKGTPATLVYWLRALGILNEEGIAALKPYIAEWWA